MVVLISAKKLDVSFHLGNILKGFRNLGRDEEAGKYGCAGRVEFYLLFGELRHLLMNLEHGPHNCSGLIHSGQTKLLPPHNPIPMQVI